MITPAMIIRDQKNNIEKLKELNAQLLQANKAYKDYDSLKKTYYARMVKDSTGKSMKEKETNVLASKEWENFLKEENDHYLRLQSLKYHKEVLSAKIQLATQEISLLKDEMKFLGG